jgi:hypothetical protein
MTETETDASMTNVAPAMTNDPVFDPGLWLDGVTLRVFDGYALVVDRNKRPDGKSVGATRYELDADRASLLADELFWPCDKQSLASALELLGYTRSRM